MSLMLSPVMARGGRGGALGGMGATERRPAGPCPLGDAGVLQVPTAERGAFPKQAANSIDRLSGVCHWKRRDTWRQHSAGRPKPSGKTVRFFTKRQAVWFEMRSVSNGKCSIVYFGQVLHDNQKALPHPLTREGAGPGCAPRMCI